MLPWPAPRTFCTQEVGNLDLVESNLVCVRGLPGAHNLDVAAAQRYFDYLASIVSNETSDLLHQFHAKPQQYNNSEPYFRVLALVTVLQRDLGILYRLETVSLDDHTFFSHSDNLFLHGIVQAKKGTCATLPVAYAAVGRRLGYPMKLVTCSNHLFARWDVPGGERFNIECAALGLHTFPDDYYMKWPLPTSPQDVAKYGAMRSRTPQEELSLFLLNRGTCFLENGMYREAALAFAEACDFAPQHDGLKGVLFGVMKKWDFHLRSSLFAGFPAMRLKFPPRSFPSIPLEMEREILHMIVKENLLSDARMKEDWWDPLRKDPDKDPPSLPHCIDVDYSSTASEPPKLSFHKAFPASWNLSKLRPA